MTSQQVAYDDAFCASSVWWGWHLLANLLTKAFARALYVIPFAGYVILYSDYFSKLFHFPVLGPSGHSFLPVMLRLHLIYYGSLLLLLAYISYQLAVPTLLRNKTSVHQFVSEVLSTKNYSVAQAALQENIDHLEAVEMHGLSDKERAELESFVTNMKARLSNITFNDDNPNTIPNALHFYYKWKNRTRQLRATIILIITGIGYSCLLLPALDIFQQVVRMTYRSLVHV
ncbi:hypothetical protein SAMN02990966_06500 [Rhodospirillales bacterium URHD0017]|nr:hypothetical protein SAMN02990966_06500 [Rhodospirillales bacterium URHD0017]